MITRCVRGLLGAALLTVGLVHAEPAQEQTLMAVGDEGKNKKSADFALVVVDQAQIAHLKVLLDELYQQVRDPRPNGLVPGTPAYPVVPVTVDVLDAISACICAINAQLNPGGISVLGTRCDVGVDLCNCTDATTVDNLNVSVVALLKTLIREVRGLVGTAPYCVACPAVSPLPANLECLVQNNNVQNN